MRARFIPIMALMICALSFFPSVAKAELVPIAITAEVTDVRDDYDFLEGKVNTGDAVTGVYIYNTSTPDSEPAEFMGAYRHYAPPAGITLTVGGFVFMTDPDNVELIVEIKNDYTTIAGGRSDVYELESRNNLPLSNGVPVSKLRLFFSESPGDALSSDALPTTAPVLADWDLHDIRIWGGTRGQGFRVDALLTSAVLIPEPATIALLAGGGLLWLRKHRGKNNGKVPVAPAQTR